MKNTDPDVGMFADQQKLSGASILTLVVGQLLSLGWTVTFLASSAGFFSIDPLSALCPLWERKENKRKKRPKQFV